MKKENLLDCTCVYVNIKKKKLLTLKQIGTDITNAKNTKKVRSYKFHTRLKKKKWLKLIPYKLLL